MKTIFKTLIVAFVAFGSLSLISCKKYLDEKPRSSLTIANKISDYQALLEQPNVINDNDVAAGEVSAGDVYMTDVDYLARAEEEQRMYTWQNSRVFNAAINDWYYSYQVIYRSNTVIDGMLEIPITQENAKAWKDVSGQGYYYRAKSFLAALGNWAPAYGPTAS
ncbi:MAG: hypothetical protein EOO91_11840, partial [Pedobacter sp.]